MEKKVVNKLNMNGVQLSNGMHFTAVQKETCQKHPGENIHKYCSVCSELVCKICLLGLHRRHQADDIGNIVGEKKRELTNLQCDIRKIQLPNLKSILSTVKQVKEENNKDSEKTEDTIRQRSEQLKEAIDQITNKCVEEAKNLRVKRESVLEKTVSGLEKTLKELSLCVKMCQDALESNDCLHVIQSSKKIKMQTDKIGTSATVPSLLPLQFSPGKLSSRSIDASFGLVSGEVHATPFDHFEIVSSIKLSKSAINFVNPKINGTWVSYDDSNDLHLTDIDGRIQKTIALKKSIEGMEVMSDGNIILSIPEEKCVKLLTLDGTLKDMICTKPLKPWGLCVTQNGDILVCTFEECGFPVKSGRRRLVQRFSYSGQVIAEIEYEDELNLFNLPYRIREGGNGTIAVVDVISKDSARIVALKNSGKVEFIYDGARTVNPHSKFNPYDICFDSINNLLIADKDSKAVHMLDCNGFCLMYCITYTDCFPTALGLSTDGTIWVGYSNGKIEVWRPKYHALIYHHDD